MFQRMMDQPWISLGMLVTLVLLYVGATLRIRRDRNLKARAIADRRKTPRPASDRRWHSREPKA